MRRGITHARLKLLVLTLVLANLHVPTNQLGGQAGILTPTANRLGQVLLINGDVHNLIFLVERNTTNLCGLECLGNKLADVVIPSNDVDLLVIELPHDVFDACSAKTNTGTHRVNLVVMGEDRNLGAVAGFPGN